MKTKLILSLMALAVIVSLGASKIDRRIMTTKDTNQSNIATKPMGGFISESH